MMQPFRMPEGGRIDRASPLSFRFDGRDYQGFAGDTLASALLANDVQLVGRSFKYHRPRGVVAAGVEEPNALVMIDRGGGRVTPNLRATQVELYEGLVARSQNRFPSLRFDVGAWRGLAAPLLSAGFVYKSFMQPRSGWRGIYEPAIRRAAGLGRSPADADPDRYEHQFAHCDLLIVGGGAAGLATALGACVTGARVILCDEQAELGGWLLGSPSVGIDGWPAPDWVREALAALQDKVTLLPRTTAFGWYPDNAIGLVERVTDHLPAAPPGVPRERLWRVKAGRVVLATGAIERPMVFPGNDRPGVMLAGAARTYLHRYGVKVGQRAVVVTAGDGGYHAAFDLHQAGLAIAGIVDQRTRPDAAALDAAQALAIPVHSGMTVVSAEGRLRVHSVRLSDRTGVIPCDTVLMAGGWSPVVHLAGQSGASLRFDEARGAFLPTEDAIGACAGVSDLAACLRDGIVAGGSAPLSFAVIGHPAVTDERLPTVPPPHSRAFVDLQNDVTTKDVAVAVEEGFVAMEHLKRYTTAGMATDQGKTSSFPVAAMLGAITGQDLGAVGHTTFRPPYTPVTFGALAGPVRGALYAPVRRTPIHTDGMEEEYDGWRRVRCFPQGRESDAQAVARECLAVRQGVGIFDASPLGKLEIAGPDAAIFLDRICPGDHAGMEVGSCRHALLLGEDGFVRNELIVARLGARHFLVITEPGAAGPVSHHMEDYLQTEFTDLLAWITPVTEQWAVIAVHGPSAVALLAPLWPDIDFGALRPMALQETRIGQASVRLLRLHVTGETGFEIHLPPRQAQAVWDRLAARTANFDAATTRPDKTGVAAVPVGLEAMRVLRAEQGRIAIGRETDATVTAADLGLERTLGAARGDFVGRRSLALPELTRPDRLQLVGLMPDESRPLLVEGAQVTETGAPPAIGHIIVAAHSPTLAHGFALAFLAHGRSRIGERVRVQALGRTVTAVVTSPVLQRPAPVQRPPIDGLTSAGTPVRPAPADPMPVAVPTSRPTLHADQVSLRPLAPTIRLCVRARAPAATALGLALGVLLPTAPNRSVIARDRAALWIGPDEWLVHAPEDTHGLVEQATRAARSQVGSIVDVSWQTEALEIAGPRAAWHLNGFCALDLDPAVFPAGMCARTLFGKAEVVLWRMAGDMFHVDVPRSLVPYVWSCLEQRLRPYSDEPYPRPELS